MDLINTIHTINNIIHPHYYLVDDPYSDTPITNFEILISYKIIFWKLNGKNGRIISTNKQNNLAEMVRQLNIGKIELCKINGIGKYLVLDLQEY
jgi:hypothetical protein